MTTRYQVSQLLGDIERLGRHGGSKKFTGYLDDEPLLPLSEDEDEEEIDEEWEEGAVFE
ncbi:hypothetical protein K2Q16_03345 [Patescibacteria group bacterium]|nr:hypothetical protein [Patescibacteria group bacterium]